MISGFRGRVTNFSNCTTEFYCTQIYEKSGFPGPGLSNRVWTLLRKTGPHGRPWTVLSASDRIQTVLFRTCVDVWPVGPNWSRIFFFFVIVRSGPSFLNFPVLIRSYHTERFWSVDPCLHGTLIDLLRVNRTLKPYLRHKKKPNFRILRIFRITVDWLSIVISIYCNSSN